MAVKKVEFGGQTLIDLTGDTATVNDVLSGKTFHANDGTVQSGSIATQAAQTITPTTTNQTIASGVYLAGTQTVLGDANLVASNIADGVTIFGVSGTHQGGGGITDADIIQRTASTFDGALINSTASYVASGAFAFCTNLRTVSLSATIVHDSAFMSCHGISSLTMPECVTVKNYAFCGAFPNSILSAANISFPKCTSVGDYAFAAGGNYWYGSVLYFPSLVTIGNYAFFHHWGPATATFTKCQTIGNYAFAADLIELTASYAKSWSFPSCTTINQYAFASIGLTSLSLPLCSYIGDYAFYNCQFLQYINLPECQTIGIGAFSAASSVVSASIPKAGAVPVAAFHACPRLVDVYLPSVTIISGSTALGGGAFADCSSLQLGTYFSISTVFSKCVTIGSYAFVKCGSVAQSGIITSTLFPLVQSISSCAFSGCTGLVYAEFPKCLTIGASAFSGCTSLQTLSFPALSRIGNSTAFRGCTRLISLYLMGSSVAVLSTASTAFSSTPIGGYSTVAGQYGSIYVPASLLASYQAASGWKSLSARIVGI